MFALQEKASHECRTLHESPVRIGRADDNDLVVTGREVSRHHCEVRKGLFGKWALKQLVSPAANEAGHNCSFVKRTGKVKQVMSGAKAVKLQEGDEIALGQREDEPPDFQFVFCRR